MYLALLAASNAAVYTPTSELAHSSSIPEAEISPDIATPVGFYLNLIFLSIYNIALFLVIPS